MCVQYKDIYSMNNTCIWNAIFKIAQTSIDERLFNAEEKMLYALGLEPIQRMVGKKLTSELGQGGFQTAYEVLYGDERAVAKISYGKNNPDAKITKELSDLRKKLPEKYKKHVMKVFDKFEFDDKIILIVEYLVPLPKSFKTLFDPFDIPRNARDKVMKDRITVWLSDYTVMTKIIEESIIDNLRRFFIIDNNVRKIASSWKKRILRKINGLEDKIAEYFIKQDDTILNIFINIIEETVNFDDIERMIQNNGIEFIKNKTPKETYDYIEKDIARDMARQMSQLLEGLFPMRGDVNVIDKFLRHESREAKEFFEFLQYLSKLGLKWIDVHGDNVMLRPGKKDFVLSDPGLFSGKLNK